MVSKLLHTVNQLNFAAVKFRSLPIHALFLAIKFRVFWPTLLHISGLNSLNNGTIFKIVSETRDQAHIFCVLLNFANLVKNAKFAKLNRAQNFVDLQYPSA